MFLKKLGFILAVFGFLCTLQAFDLQEVSKSALKEHKLILLSVESVNCRYCEKMNEEVFTPDEYSQKISHHSITLHVYKILKWLQMV